MRQPWDEICLDREDGPEIMKESTAFIHMYLKSEEFY